ncbi:MAG: PIG-L family deacetylase, partial [Candidatus Tectomicrobia bacterium]|nr:PIG-L family deacetylase [Candidatus Tectomicrobia bacterium]
AGRGARLTLVCATNGDVGEISDPALATRETLARVRQEELRRAMAVTGVQDVRFLDYRDSGMAGTADNQHPEALMQAPADQVTGRLVEVMREVRPRVVITHDPTGGYGHPDHVTVCRRVTEAFHTAADPRAYPGRMAPWAPELLYYVCFPRSFFRRMWQYLREAGIRPPFASEEVEALGTPDDEVTTVLDVEPHVATKIASLNCHRTQLDPQGPFHKLPAHRLHDMMRNEYFTLALPSGAGTDADLLGRLAPAAAQRPGSS